MRLSRCHLLETAPHQLLRLGYALGEPYRFGLSWRQYVNRVLAVANATKQLRKGAMAWQ